MQGLQRNLCFGTLYAPHCATKVLILKPQVQLEVLSSSNVASGEGTEILRKARV